MSFFNLSRSLARAEERLKDRPPPGRRPRSDRGKSRLSPVAQATLTRLLSDRDKPRMSDVLAALRKACVAAHQPCPSRAAVYQFLDRAPVPLFEVSALPLPVQRALYNVAPEARVP